MAHFGLREVLLELIQKYGKQKPISESGFFDELVAMTFPEIRSFIDSYILDAKPLPLQEYYEKIGIHYNPEQRHLFSPMKKLSPRQQKLQQAWSENLDVNVSMPVGMEK